MSLTRAIVIASAVLAVFGEAYLATSYAPQIFWIGAAGFVVLLVAGLRLRPIALPILMASLYVAPAILLVTIKARGYEMDVIWILPLLGLILSGGREVLQWSLPARWQWPLITWATLVAIAWPIVFLREADFALWILPLERVSNTSIGVSPWLAGQMVAYFAIGHLVGILWIDALCRWYRGAPDRLRPEVLSGLMAAAGIAAAVAIYQGFVDLGFLNEGFWEYMIRASGTLADPNKLASVTAFWTIGAIVFSRRMPRPWSAVIAVMGLMLGVAAVWVSGSRTGLAVVMASVGIAAVEALRWSRLDARKLAMAAGGAVALGALLVVALQGASTHTIVQRGTLGYLPFFGDRGISNSANELLWDRFGYGPVAIQMVKEHPISGVGVGMYHNLSHDFGQAIRRTIPMPDNAQAWWRHNLAELGAVGIIPLLIWCVVFGRQLFAKSASGDRFSIGILRGVLIAFFVASLFGVPSQSVAIALTFWLFVFWFFVEHGSLDDHAGPVKVWPRVLTVAAVAIITIHAGMTTVDALGDLRPRERSQRFNWFYRYGYLGDGAAEADPGGNPVGRRLTMKDSLAVVPVKGKVLKFVAWIDHPDADQKPVHTRVWADSQLIYEGDLRRSPLVIDIPATPGKTHMVLETSVDRVWRPSDFGSRDRREIGLSIRDWVWE